MDIKSKTQKKKDALLLQELGEKLVMLPPQQIEDIDLPAEVREAVMFARTLKSHGARRRQLQFIGTLMRKIDVRPIQEAILDIETGSYRKAIVFRETERYRDQLIAGDTDLFEKILKRCPDADRQRLLQLVRNAVREKEHGKAPRASRALFRHLMMLRASTCLEGDRS